MLYRLPNKPQAKSEEDGVKKHKAGMNYKHITYNILNKLPAAFNQHTKRTTLHHTQHTHTTSTNTSTHKHATDHTQHTYTHTQKSHAAHITVPHARTNPHNTDNTDTTQTHHNAA